MGVNASFAALRDFLITCFTSVGALLPVTFECMPSGGGRGCPPDSRRDGGATLANSSATRKSFLLVAASYDEVDDFPDRLHDFVGV
jgi:hypothetical protein